MLIILLTNGMSSFGLKVLVTWGPPSTTHFPYLMIWNAAGLASIGVPMIVRKQMGGQKEIGWRAALAGLSIGGAAGHGRFAAGVRARQRRFPGGNWRLILVVAVVDWLFSGEKMHPVSWGGARLGWWFPVGNQSGTALAASATFGDFPVV